MSDSTRSHEPLDNTEVFDEVDLAQMQAQRSLDALLEAHQAKMKPETHPDFDGIHCLDCDNDIPALRLQMGKIRCVHCQTALEHYLKMHPGAKRD
jgi:RNA polymerase-binding transcription factor DksA